MESSTLNEEELLSDKFEKVVEEYCYYGSEESFRLLSHHNSNVDIQGYNGWTALMYASANGYKNRVQLLLNHNADIHVTRNDGKTALDLAQTREIKEMIRNHVNTSYILK